MRSMICKIFGFILDLFVLVVEAVGFALKTIGTVVIDVLSALAGAVGEALGVDGSTILWLGLGAAALWFLFKDKDDGKTKYQPEGASLSEYLAAAKRKGASL